MIIVQMGDQIHGKCSRAFSRHSKTDHGTFWWKDVTCDDCIDRMCTTPEVTNYFNNKEIQW